MALAEKSELGWHGRLCLLLGEDAPESESGRRPVPLESERANRILAGRKSERKGGEHTGPGRALVGFWLSLHEVGAYKINLFYVVGECVWKLSDRISWQTCGVM